MRDRPALRALPMVGMLLGPFAALLVVMAVRGIPMGAGAVSIADRSRAVRFGSDTFAWAPDTFAPLLPFLTAAAGSRPVVPVAATAVLVAVTLAVVVRVLLRNGVHRAVTVAVVGTVALTPAVYLAVLDHPDLVAALALVLLAAVPLLDGTRQGVVSGGLGAGAVLAAAVMVAPGAWLPVATVVVLAAVLARRAVPTDRHAPAAAAVVVAFPALVATAFWGYLAWWFTDAPLDALAQLLPRFPVPGGDDVAGLVATALFALPLLLGTVLGPRADGRPGVSGSRARTLPLLLLCALPWASDGGPALVWVLVAGTALAVLATGAPGSFGPRRLMMLAVVQIALGWLVVLL